MVEQSVEVLRSELAELRTEMRDLRTELHELSGVVEKLKVGDASADPVPRKPLNITVASPSNFGDKFHQWNSKAVAKAPAGLPKPYSALKDGKVYFNAGLTTRGGQYQSFVYCFNLGDEKWSTLPKSSQYYSSVAVIQDMVTLIGGKQEKNGRVTGNLLSFHEAGMSGEWQECLPPLPNPRFFTGAATCQNILVVAGGDNSKERVATVEVLDMDSMQWTEVSPLPEPTSNASVAIIGDSVYVLAGMQKKGSHFSNAAFTCSLTALVESSPSDGGIWESLPNVPSDAATAAVMCNTLVAVGGWTTGRTDPVKTMVAYSVGAKKWNVIGYLTKPRGLPGVIPLNNGTKTLVVGGQLSSVSYMDEAEIIEAKN